MTKVMEISEIVRINKQKKQTGDYITLAQVLETTVDAARMRIIREDENAHRMLYQIIEQREKIVSELKNKDNE